MEDQQLDTAETFEDYNNYNDYYSSITLRPVLGGWTVAYSDKNPNFVERSAGEAYKPKLHVLAISRTRIFTDATKMVEWLNQRMQKETK